MNNNKSLVFLCLVTSGISFNMTFAAVPEQTTPEQTTPEQAASEKTTSEKTEPELSDSMFPPSMISKPIFNEVELGFGYVSDDSYKFGRYNGMESEGAFVQGNINVRKFMDDGYFMSIRGTNLGLDSRYLRIEGGQQGNYELFLEYDRTPNYKSDTVKTPFYGVGSNNLTLPPGFDINTNLNANLKEFDLETRRERIGTGLSFIPIQRWQFDVDFSHENKKGLDITGAAMAGPPAPGGGSGNIVGNTTTALIPEPIDYDTNKVNATLSYIGDDGQMDLSYHMSLFKNDDDNLNWQNPFNTGYATGNMSLPPDNEFHQLSLTGAYNLPYKSRITGLLSSGRMTQDQDFQPYTTNSGLITTALPSNSLDGEVWVTNAHLKLISRPIQKLRLNAEFRYNDHDNDTPVESYDYVVLDSRIGTTVTNRPYSYENQRINLDANYRFNSTHSLRGGYKYNEMKRSYTGEEEREETDEDTLFAKWKIKAHTDVALALFTEYSTRDGSNYHPSANENQAMRRFFLADRDRTKYGTSVDYMATERLSLSARAEYNKDDYDGTSIGLKEEAQPTYALDFSYQPNDKVTFYGYYTYERIHSEQAGYDVASGPGALTTDWEADYDDTFNTYGIGFKWSDLNKLELGGDIVYAKSTGEIDMKDVFNPGTEDQYPDNETSRTSIKLWANYKYNKNMSYKLALWYEDYDEDNWAFDDVPAYTANSGALFLDGDSPDYDATVITLSGTYRF